MAPDGDIRERFKFPMTPDGYRVFAGKILRETKIAFEASGSAYACLRKGGEGRSRPGPKDVFIKKVKLTM